MTTIDDISMVEDNACLPSKRNLCVPQQLSEVNELLKSINRRLEDCALEWQAEISRKQWKIFNSNGIGITSSERSLLARTYFTEKNLDEAFQHLLSCNKIFSEYLKNFIDLLQDEVSVSNVKETCDVQNQCFNKKKSCKVLDITNGGPTQLSPLLNGEEKVQDYIDNILTVQNSFTDVVKAKINFDTKFLGFEAVLHKATSTSTDAVCLCQCCSSIMQATHGTHRKLRSVTLNQRNRTVAKPKRLIRSKRTLSKKKKKEKSSTVVDKINNQLPFETHTGIC
ncbi:uncharacterized protein LOC126917527 [Bombus affinis]|uniref:uncharacterized protein LOC126917527 n=1 Tax=Bombus affinis TaxID=309941 RepID=UPI0021B7708C|nr:uncharacterized protein LOC126917527 [Bombus affinis]